jgi:hypothetical protein
LTDVSEVVIVSIIALLMDGASTSETSVHFCETTRRNIPEDGHFQSDSHFVYKYSFI